MSDKVNFNKRQNMPLMKGLALQDRQVSKGKNPILYGRDAAVWPPKAGRNQ